MTSAGRDIYLDTHPASLNAEPIESTSEQHPTTDFLVLQPHSIQLPEHESDRYPKPAVTHPSALNPRASPWYPEVNIGVGPNHFAPSTPDPPDAEYTRISPPLPNYPQGHMMPGIQSSASPATTSQIGLIFPHSSIWVPPLFQQGVHYPSTHLPPDSSYGIPYSSVGSSGPSGHGPPPFTGHAHLAGGLLPLTTRASSASTTHIRPSFPHAHSPSNAIVQGINGPTSATMMVPNQPLISFPGRFPQIHPFATQIHTPAQYMRSHLHPSAIQSAYPTDQQWHPISSSSVNNTIQNCSNSSSHPPNGQYIANPVAPTSQPSSGQVNNSRDWSFSQTPHPNKYLRALFFALLDYRIRGQPEPIYGSPTSTEIIQRLPAEVQRPSISAREAGKSMYISFIQNGVCLFCFRSVGAKKGRSIGHIRSHMDHRAFICTYGNCSVCTPDRRESFFTYERLKDHMERQQMTECPQCHTVYRLDNRSRHSCSVRYNDPPSS